MKNRIMIALTLALALTTVAMAQQPASGQDQSQPAASSSQTQQSSEQAGQNAQAQQAEQEIRKPLTYEEKQGFWGKINPFARKKYVQKHLEPVRSRVNELDEITANNAKMIRDVDSRATEGIRLAHNKANEADMHAVDAGNRANVAHETANQANTRLQTVEQAINNLDQYQVVSETEIRFRSGQSALSTRAKEALDEIATQLKGQRGFIVQVQGFAPGRGIASLEQSENMAEAVARYLVLNHEIPVYRIFVVGMGNAPAQRQEGETSARRSRGGRVEVALLKNATADLSTEPIQTPTSQSQGGVTGTMQQDASSQQPAQPAQPGVSQPAQPQQGQQPAQQPPPQTPPPGDPR